MEYPEQPKYSCWTCFTEMAIDDFPLVRQHKKYVYSKHCKSCLSVRRKASRDRYRANHPDRVKEQSRNQNRKQWQKAKSDPSIMERRNAKMREWLDANKDRRREASRKWVDRNRESYMQRIKDWKYKQDPERLLEMGRKSYHKNREEILERRKKYRSEGRYSKFKILRRSRIRHAPGKTSEKLLEQKLEYYGYKCRYCRVDLVGKNLSFDHAIPVARGGTSWTSNLLPCCRNCNSAKSDWTFFEYIERLGRCLNQKAC